MRILNAVRPTETQKQILAKIASAATPKLAAGNIIGNQNLLSARDMLAKLGIITFSPNEAALTDAGEQLARDENIIDDSGQLTDVGNKLAFGDQNQPPVGAGTGMEPQQPTLQVEPGSEGMNIESVSLLSYLLKL